MTEHDFVTGEDLVPKPAYEAEEANEGRTDSARRPASSRTWSTGRTDGSVVDGFTSHLGSDLPSSRQP